MLKVVNGAPQRERWEKRVFEKLGRQKCWQQMVTPEKETERKLESVRQKARCGSFSAEEVEQRSWGRGSSCILPELLSHQCAQISPSCPCMAVHRQGLVVAPAVGLGAVFPTH